MRVQKYLAQLGLASRREAEQWIKDGEVTLNGEIAEIGASLDPQKDRVMVRGRTVQSVSPQKITLLMNKPKGVLCSNEDPHHESTVFNLLPPRFTKTKLFCAGRLDKDSEGMLILTNDGDLAQEMTHPAQQIPKFYRVKLNRDLDPECIPKLIRGREIEGEFLKFEKVIVPPSRQEGTGSYQVILYHGRKREIRRLFQSFGYFVKKLQRYQIGSLPLKGLAKGQCRKLTDKEIQRLLDPGE